LEADLNKVPVGPVLDVFAGHEYLSGSGAAHAHLRTQGFTLNEWQQHLDGSFDVQIDEGAVYGIDLQPMLERIDERLLDILAGRADAISRRVNLDKQTQFDSLRL